MFNALLYSQELQKAGFSQDQADASLRILIEVMNENFATKSDMKELAFAVQADFKETRLVLRSEIQAVRTELKAEIQSVKTELQSEIQAVRTELKAEIQSVRTGLQALENKFDSLGKDLTIRLGTMMFAATGIIIASMGMMLKLSH